MSAPTASPDAPLPAGDARAARGLARGLAALVTATTGLIVLGALVRAHEAGLSCPDWPLCFGRIVPAFDVRVAFEWSHRVVAGSVALGYAALAAGVLARPALRRRFGGHALASGALLALQVLLGALTVWHLLARWSVTSHLVVGNSFNASLLWLAFRLRRAAGFGPRPAPATPALRGAVAVALGLLALQVVLGGLVSSGYAGLACPEWPACNGGQWFPTWRGAVGLHLLHRWNALALVAALAVCWRLARGTRGLAGPAALALALVAAQFAVGVANVRLGLPVEVTGLHSALAAGLVLALTSLAVRALGAGGGEARVLEPSATGVGG